MERGSQRLRMTSSIGGRRHWRCRSTWPSRRGAAQHTPAPPRPGPPLGLDHSSYTRMHTPNVTPSCIFLLLPWSSSRQGLPSLQDQGTAARIIVPQPRQIQPALVHTLVHFPGHSLDHSPAHPDSRRRLAPLLEITSQSLACSDCPLSSMQCRLFTNL